MAVDLYAYLAANNLDPVHTCVDEDGESFAHVRDQ
jgi:hypothetical protein